MKLSIFLVAALLMLTYTQAQICTADSGCTAVAAMGPACCAYTKAGPRACTLKSIAAASSGMISCENNLSSSAQSFTAYGFFAIIAALFLAF